MGLPVVLGAMVSQKYILTRLNVLRIQTELEKFNVCKELWENSLNFYSSVSSHNSLDILSWLDPLSHHEGKYLLFTRKYSKLKVVLT